MSTSYLQDVDSLRHELKNMQMALKNDMDEHEHPEAMLDLIDAMGRVEKELANKKSQQMFEDFFMVMSFIQSVGPDDDDEDYEDDDDYQDDDEDDDDEDYDEDEDEDEENDDDEDFDEDEEDEEEEE